MNALGSTSTTQKSTTQTKGNLLDEHHTFAPREPRLVVMNDREIQAALRCYRCGGHHVGRVTCGSKCGLWHGAALGAASLLTAVIAALCVF